jgi:hypothetical protein
MLFRRFGGSADVFNQKRAFFTGDVLQIASRHHQDYLSNTTILDHFKALSSQPICSMATETSNVSRPDGEDRCGFY